MDSSEYGGISGECTVDQNKGSISVVAEDLECLPVPHSSLFYLLEVNIYKTGGCSG